jgi:hypothetical protein
MGAAFIGFIIGFALGAGSGTAGGAFIGGVLGMLVGVAAHSAGWIRAHRGDAPTIERHRVVCTPYGKVADIEFEGDLETRRWLDVKRCSLLPVAGTVACDKRCLHQLSDSGIKPGAPCSCES